MKEKGYTLIELLTLLAILSLVFVGITMNISNLINKTNENVDKTVKNMILEASKDYTLEFRRTKDWYEELTEEGNVNFCVSIDSLINKGYFKNNNEQIIKYKNEYVVKATVVNDVYNYDFVKFENLENEDLCKYYKKDTVIKINEQPEIEISEEGNKLGTLEYDLSKLDEKLFQMNFNLDINISYNETASSNDVYIPFILDTSGSMYTNNGFIPAKTAVIDFSKQMIDGLPNSKIALIQYTAYPMLRRNFEHSYLTDENVIDKKNGDTNSSGGVDLTTSLLYNDSIKTNDNTQIYAILLYDGQPTSHSKMYYKETNSQENFDILTVNTITETNKDYYFKNFLTAVKNREENNKDKLYISYTNANNTKSPIDANANGRDDDLDALIESSKYIKELTGATLIVIGYNFTTNKTMKTIATVDNDFCFNSDYKNDNNNYCYYDSTSGNISNLFSKILEKILIKNTNAIASRIIIEPKKINGEDVITISQNGEKLPENKIIKSVDLPETSETNIFNVNLSGTYEFAVNDSLFEKCKEQQCNLNKDLFDIYVQLVYPNEVETKVEIDDPVFEVIITKIDTLN